MLTLYPVPKPGVSPVWIDASDPTDEERQQVKADFSVEIPSRADLSEIESSSRLVNRDGVLRLSLPLLPSDEGASAPPFGFVLNDKILVTVRFSEVHSIEQAKRLFDNPARPRSVDVFETLLEAMVDYSADLLAGC
jgi:magnesium transporter